LAGGALIFSASPPAGWMTVSAERNSHVVRLYSTVIGRKNEFVFLMIIPESDQPSTPRTETKSRDGSRLLSESVSPSGIADPTETAGDTVPVEAN